MSKIQTLNEKIEAAQTEIRQKENRLKELRRQQKEVERKARTRRLCTRGGHIESRLTETIMLTDEQFFTFVEKAILSPQSRNILNSIIAQSGNTNSAGAEDATKNR